MEPHALSLIQHMTRVAHSVAWYHRLADADDLLNETLISEHDKLPEPLTKEFTKLLHQCADKLKHRKARRRDRGSVPCDTEDTQPTLGEKKVETEELAGLVQAAARDEFEKELVEVLRGD
ncbi:MAG: hypothetical protein AB7O26_19625, partial [Planctomycetaceae bacterium]